MPESEVSIGGFRTPTKEVDDDFARTHQLLRDVHERLFKHQMDVAERVSALSLKLAHDSVQLLEVFANASATLMGKTVQNQGKEAADTLLEVIRKIKAEFTAPAPAPAGNPTSGGES